jgi:hypothetical protein
LCLIAVDIVCFTGGGATTTSDRGSFALALLFLALASCGLPLREPFMHVCAPRLENVIKPPSPSRLRISHFTFWTTPSIFKKSMGHQLMSFQQCSQWGSCVRQLPDLCPSEVTRFREYHAPHFRDAARCVRRAMHAADRTYESLVGGEDVAPPTATVLAGTSTATSDQGQYFIGDISLVSPLAPRSGRLG